MSSIAEAFVSVRADMSGFTKDVSKGVNKVNPDAAGKKFGSRFGGSVSSALNSTMGKAVAGLSGAMAVSMGVNMFKGFITDARESAKIGALTEQVIKSTGSAAGVSAQQVSSLAGAIAAKTGYDDEAIQSGQNLLLTFTNVKNAAGAGNDVFNQTTAIMTDMSVALGQDTKASAMQLGKALNDPIRGVTALQRVGVAFTADQKKQIETLVQSGKTMDAQKIILAELGKEFGGAAAAAATPMDKLKVATGNIGESIGTMLLPAVDRFATFLLTTGVPAVEALLSGFRGVKTGGEGLAGTANNIGNTLRGAFGFIKAEVLPALQGMAGFMQRNSDVIVPLVTVIGTFIVGVRTIMAITTAWTAVQAAFNLVMAMNPIGLTVIAIAALVAGAIIAYKKIDWFRVAVDKAFSVIATAASYVFDFFKNNWPLILGIITGPIGLVVLTITKNWDTIKTATTKFVGAVFGFFGEHWQTILAVITGPIGLVVLTITKNWDTIKTKTSEFIGGVVTFFTELPGKIGDALSSLGKKVSDIATAAWNWFKDTTVTILVAYTLWVTGLPDRIMGGLNVLKQKLFDFASLAWNGFKDKTTEIVTSFVTYVTGIPGRVMAGVAVLKTQLSDFAATVWNGFSDKTSSIVNKVIDFVKGVPGRVADGLGQLGTLILDKVRDGIRPVLDFINNNVVDNLNKVIDPLPGDFKIPRIDYAFAAGGVVPGYAPGRDSVLAALSPGEGILRPETTRALGGKAAIDELNRWGMGFAKGGIIPDWVKSGAGAVKNAAVGTVNFGLDLGKNAVDLAGDIYRMGADKAMAAVLNPLIGLMRARGFGGDVISNMGIGVLEKMKTILTSWGSSIQTDPGGIPTPSGGFMLPLPAGSYRNTSGYGWRIHPIRGTGRFHAGLDLAAAFGTPVYAPFAGMLQNLVNPGGYGNYVKVSAGGLEFRGGHLASHARGDGMVNAGELIGRVGSTGASTGPHLHAEFRRGGAAIDPRSLMGFDLGGILPHGGIGVNKSGKPERVLSPSQTEVFDRLVAALSGKPGGAPLKVDVHVQRGERRVGWDIATALENTLMLNGWAA